MSDWRDSANCATTDPELFFPEAGEMHSKMTKAALDICSRCPVEYECWWDAVESAEEPWGIRGGQKPADLAKAIVDRHGPEVAGNAIRERVRLADRHQAERDVRDAEVVDLDDFPRRAERDQEIAEVA